MRVADLVREDVLLIVPQLHASTRDDVLEELATFLAHHHREVSAEDVVRALANRERLGSTAVGDGLAIPHAKLFSARKLLACFGRSRKGVDFGAPDGKPTRFFFVLIAPENAPGEHLTALARISRLFNDSGFRGRLDHADTAQEIYDVIAAADVG